MAVAKICINAYHGNVEHHPDAAQLIRAKKALIAAGITQDRLATEISASQSQVSRALAGKSPKRSVIAKRIIAYANGMETIPSAGQVREQTRLIAALSEVWDGSDEHAAALEIVIRSLGALSMRPSPTSARTTRRHK